MSIGRLLRVKILDAGLLSSLQQVALQAPTFLHSPHHGAYYFSGSYGTSPCRV